MFTKDISIKLQVKKNEELSKKPQTEATSSFDKDMKYKKCRVCDWLKR
jgi:hypothetical protein